MRFYKCIVALFNRDQSGYNAPTRAAAVLCGCVGPQSKLRCFSGVGTPRVHTSKGLLNRLKRTEHVEKRSNARSCWCCCCPKEMDEYSDFASDDFDVKGWINATVASHLQSLQAAGGAESNGSSATSDPSNSPSLAAHRWGLCLRR